MHVGMVGLSIGSESAEKRRENSRICKSGNDMASYQIVFRTDYY